MTDRRLAVMVGLGVTLVLLLFELGSVDVVDGNDMLAVTHSILHHASLAVPPANGVLAPDGHYYAKYGIALSVVMLPLVAAGGLASAVVGHHAQIEAFAAASTMPIITGVLAAVLWTIARRLGAGRRWASAIAVGAVFGTYALPYGRELFSEPLTTLGIAIALERILAGRFAVAGLGMALAFTSRPETILLLPVFSLTLLVFRVPLRAGAVFTAVAATGVVVDALYNLARFGNLTSTGYVGEGFTTPFLHGAGGLLFGTNKSLFLFAPVMLLLLVLAVRGLLRRDLYATLASETFVVLFLAAALWHSWQGGWSWGPRLLLPGVLCLMPLLARARRVERRAALGLLAVGFVVSASTVIVQTGTQQLDRPQPVNGPSVPRQYALIPHVVSYSANHIHAKEFGGITRRYVALWQVNAWRALGTPGLMLGVVGSLLLLAALAAVLRAVRPVLVGRPPLLPWPTLWRHV